MSTIIYPSPIFGPVHSRRLGVSLGINLMPADGKVCTFDCIYCECGFNADHRPHLKRPTREQVAAALEEKLRDMSINGPRPDVLTFAGNGEPTAHPHFPEIIDEEFTAQVENDLDKVEQDGLVWTDMIGQFYAPFKTRVGQVMEKTESVKGFLDEQTDKVCELCGKPMVKKLGRFGFFLACSGFPACHNTKSVPLAKCPVPGCGGEIVERKTKGRGKAFYGCTNYPKCTFISHFKPIDSYCPKCGWFLVEKYDKKNGAYKSCINPDCDYLHSADDEEKAPAKAEAEE